MDFTRGKGETLCETESNIDQRVRTILAISTDTNNYWKAGKGIRGHKHSKPTVAVPFDFFFLSIHAWAYIHNHRDMDYTLATHGVEQ